MKLVVQRIALTEVSTCGNLFVNNSLECWTLELPRKDGLHGSCIAAGKYKVVLNNSPRFSNDLQFGKLCQKLNIRRLMPEVLNVPNREDIRIHWGNTAKDTEGCILVGKSHSQDFVGLSRDAFAELYEKMVWAVNNFEVIELEVLDPPGVGN